MIYFFSLIIDHSQKGNLYNQRMYFVIHSVSYVTNQRCPFLVHLAQQSFKERNLPGSLPINAYDENIILQLFPPPNYNYVNVF